MSSVLLKILRIVHLARHYIARTSSRWALFVAILRRKLSEWWNRSQWPGKPGPSKPAESSFPSNGARLCSSAPGGPTVLKEYGVAASNVPASASQGSLSLRIHVSAEGQSATAPPTPIPATLSVGPSYSPNPGPSYLPVDPANFAGRSSTNVSISSTQTRASERRSRITASREALHDTPVGQPAELPRSPHHQFGRGPDPSRSGGRLSRSPSPMRPPNITQRPHHLDVIQTVPPTQPHFGGGISPIGGPQSPADIPSSPYNTQEPQRTPLTRIHQKQKTTSLDVHVESPSLEYLPIHTHLQQLTEEPTAISPTQPSIVSSVADYHETASQRPSTLASEYHVPEGRSLQLIHSEQIPRYAKNITIPREKVPYIVETLSTAFPYLADTERPDQASHEEGHNPWKPATHPDGALYFYDIKRRLFTDTDMHDLTLREEMEEFYRTLRKIVRDDHLIIPSKNYDLVLDIMPQNDDTIKWSYYYACHETRCLFWLEPYDGSYMISEIDRVKCPALVKHRLEGLYWNHWSLFPVGFEGRSLRSQVYDELLGILVHGCMDMMTSKDSTLPYDDDKMQKMITLVQIGKDAQEKGTDGGHYTAMATRLLSFFAHWRFLHFHGQRHARLVRDKTAYDEPSRERSILISLLSPLLFLAPEVHLREMEKLWTDDVIIESVWKRFMSKLLSEWNDLILWSTVMLAVSVSFLAVPGVTLYNLSNNNNEYQAVILKSSSQIASALSVETSIGSIVIGMFLVRHNRTKQEASPSEANTYLDQNCGLFGLEPMAIIFSLPWALLMWSMVTFFVALLCFCFVVSNPWTRIVVGLTSSLVVALTVLSLRTAWGSRNAWKEWVDGLRPSLIGPLQRLCGSVERHIPFITRVVESLRNCLASRVQGGARNV